VKNSVLKLSTGVGSGGSDTDIQKIVPASIELSSNGVAKPGTKSLSYQQVSQPSGDQVDVSGGINLVDSNGGSDSGEYEVVTSRYKPSQLVSSSGLPSSSETSEQTSNYVPGQEYQQISTKGTGSSSYQLIEILGGSTGREVSGSLLPVFLPLSYESANDESGKLSGYKSGDNEKVTSHVTNKNIALQFGDRVPDVGSTFIQTVSNVEQDQNEIYKKKQDIVKVTSPPIPQRHSLLRPIIVAEIYPKDDKERIETVRPIVIPPTITPATIHVSHSPESSSSILLPSSVETQSGSIVTTKHEATNKYSTPTSILSHPQDVALSYSSGSESSSHTVGSVSSNGLSGKIVTQVYSTPKPVLLSHIKKTSTSVSSSGSEGSSSDSTIFLDGGHKALAQPLVYTTPAPVIVSYAHGTSGTHEVASNTQQTPSPIIIVHPSTPTYSHTSTSIQSGTDNGQVITGVYSTPAPISLLQSQESYPSTISEENPQKQSIATAYSGNSEKVIESQHSTPASVYISHSPKSSSFSVSNSGGSFQSSSSIITTNNGNSGHISAGSAYSTTPQPAVVSHPNSEGSSTGYIVSPSAVLLNSNPQPVAPALISSVDVLAPIQAGVSLDTISHQQSTVVSGISSTPEATPQPLQVKEKVPDVPHTKTIVEVQKAVSLDINSLLLKPDKEENPNVRVPTSAVPISYTQQAVESGKQVDLNNDQQQTYAGNLIEYVYGQPLTRLQAYPQIGYSFPRLSGSTENLLYGYNPQTFDTQKVTYLRYAPEQQFNSGLHLQAPYEQSLEGAKREHQRDYAQKQVGEQLQIIPEYQQQATETEKVGQKLLYSQQLQTPFQDGSQSHHQQKDTEKQHVTTAYNLQLIDGGRQVFSQQLPKLTQVESEYSQQLEDKVKKFQAPGQISQEIKYQQPLEIRHQIEYQSPIAINQQIPYQLLSQQIGYQVPVELEQQIEFLAPTKLNQQVEQIVNTAGVLPGYNLHTNISPEQTVQFTPTNVQASAVSIQSTNVGQPLYKTKPAQLSKQLQSEYKHQLLEEEKQEQVKLSSEIGKALKQLHTNYNEGSLGTQLPLHISQEEKVVPLPLIVDYHALPPANVVPLDRPEAVVKVENPLPIEQTKLIAAEKPITVHHTKFVEKPVAVPVEVTKLVPVDRPVPYPQPYAVPHPVPVPYAVPHPIEVPVPHLVPYPQVVAVPFKEVHPIYIRNEKPQKNDFALYHHQVQNFPSNTPLPAILKALQYNGGRYGVPVSIKPHQLHTSHIPQTVYLTPPPLKPSGRGRGFQQSKNVDHLRTLCLEYGFKPPLVPSVQIHEVPPSAYGPPKKD
jgi:hypothetical protein